MDTTNFKKPSGYKNINQSSYIKTPKSPRTINPDHSQKSTCTCS